MDFWNTIQGHKLAQIIITELPKISRQLERANDLKEMELELQKQAKSSKELTKKK